MTGTKRPNRPRSGDIELVASVEADELRFDEPPETEVDFFGEPDHESASGSDRTNLPEKVERGVTYQNVRVDYRLASRLAEPARQPRQRGGPPSAERQARSTAEQLSGTQADGRSPRPRS